MIRPHPVCLLIPLLGVTVALGACTGDGAQASSASELQRMDRGDVARSMMAAAESGLLIRRWHVEGRPDRIAAALMKHAQDADIDAETTLRLERNGFRLVRVPATQLDALRDDLGGVSLDVEGRHGQSYDWRDIASWKVGDDPRAVAVDGRVRRLQGGRVNLMMRGWTIPMEDGPAVHVHLRPEHDRTRSTRLGQMLGKVAFDGERFDALSVELLLHAGSVYVLTSETPGVKWIASGDGDARHEGDAPAPGPAAAAPLTIGERLFGVSVEEPASNVLRGPEAPVPPQELLLLVPKIPAALFPPELQTAANAGRSRSSAW